MRTRAEPASRAVPGSSLGGVFALHAFLRHPDVFGNAAAISATFGWQDDLVATERSDMASMRGVAGVRCCFPMWVSTGCQTVAPLGDVPIVGATAEEEQELRAELLRFDAAVGAERVALRRVEVGSLDREPEDEWRVAGVYHHWQRVVILDEGLSSGSLAPVLRHELCHALDHQERDLSAAVHDPLFDLGGSIIDATSKVSEHDVRREAFATLCERGPEFTDLGVDACDLDSASFAKVASWMNDEVWSGWTGWAGRAPTPRPSLRATLGTVASTAPADYAILTPLVVEGGPAL
ncbi:MAG: alpha/beta hydrolase-fold protein, partial [Myxococcota bacterium]